MYAETQDGEEIYGYKITSRNKATKQSHLMTIDKKVIETELRETFNPASN
jgi:hypothetical protein